MKKSRKNPENRENYIQNYRSLSVFNDAKLIYKVIFGAITIARSKIEEFEVLKARIGEALKYIDPERLVLAPDCGLGFLDEPKILAKLEVMAKVAKEF